MSDRRDYALDDREADQQERGDVVKLQITYRPLRALVPYARNARRHPREQIQKLKASLSEFGWANPMLIADDGMIAGHGRLQAALEMAEAGIPIRGNPDPWEGPTVDLSHLTPAQRRAYILTDNRMALDGEWDDAMLSLELAALTTEGFDLDLTGFELSELSALLADKTEGLTDPDDVPEVPVEPVSVLGDVWCLGRHRLVCGDSTDAQAVERALNGVKPHLMVTDPPYGVVYDADWRNERVRKDGSAIAGRAVGKVLNDDKADWREAWALFPGDVAYVWCASLHNHEVAESLIASGFSLRSQIIWAKSNFAISRSDYHWQHEPCWYAVREGRKGHWHGDRKQTTLWAIAKPAKSETGHSTQKPVECMKRPIENNSSPGQAVYEPFSGSGTTIIACEQTGRACHAIELNPAYVDVGVKRWQDFTGQQAIHEETGKTFAELSAERLPNGSTICPSRASSSRSQTRTRLRHAGEGGLINDLSPA